MIKFIKTGMLAAAVAVGGWAAAPMAQAETLNVTFVAGHPPVFRWVKHASQTFVPAVNAALEGTDYSIEWSEQYGGSLAKVGEELEAVEEGLAEIGLVSSLFDPAKLAVQNVTYFTPFVSSDSTAVSTWMDELQQSNADMQASWHENGLEYLGGGIGIAGLVQAGDLGHDCLKLAVGIVRRVAARLHLDEFLQRGAHADIGGLKLAVGALGIAVGEHD